MARRFILEVRKAPNSPKAPYLVHVPKSLHAAEGAQRRFFEKEAIARAYVKRLAKMLGEYQLQALGLNDEQKVEAARCYRLLEKHDAGSLALEMGNSPAVIFRHYRRAMNEATALAYFKITPQDRLRPALRIAANDICAESGSRPLE